LNGQNRFGQGRAKRPLFFFRVELICVFNPEEGEWGAFSGRKEKY